MTANFVPTAPLATLNAATSYTDASTTVGTMYYYRVAAVDNAGNVSDLCNEISLKATDVEKVGMLPTDFALEQNYPNPFNPTTRIQFSLPTASPVRLAIYNVSGELVRLLVNDDLAAGTYRLTWNATDNDGRGVSSGVYIYRLQTGKFVSSRKMLLIK